VEVHGDDVVGSGDGDEVGDESWEGREREGGEGERRKNNERMSSARDGRGEGGGEEEATTRCIYSLGRDGSSRLVLLVLSSVRVARDDGGDPSRGRGLAS